MLQTSNRGIANAGMPCSHTVLCRVRSSLPLLVVVRDGPGRVPATSPQRSKTGRLPALVQEASHGPIQRFRLKFCSFPIRRRPDGPRGCHLNNALCSVQPAATASLPQPVSQSAKLTARIAANHSLPSSTHRLVEKTTAYYC
jgi:hypothetical protein